jgi:hypothetical protein
MKKRNILIIKLFIIFMTVLFLNAKVTVLKAEEISTPAAYLDQFEKKPTGPNHEIDFVGLFRSLNADFGSLPKIKRQQMANELLKRVLDSNIPNDYRYIYSEILFDRQFSTFFNVLDASELAKLAVDSKTPKEGRLRILNNLRFEPLVSSLGKSDLESLEKIASDPNEDLNIKGSTAIVLIKTVHKDNENVKQLAKKIGIESVKEKETGMLGFGMTSLLASRYEDPEVKTFLFDLLKSDDLPNIRNKKNFAIGVVERKKDKKATEAIIALMSNPKLKDTYTIQTATLALGYLGGTDATRYLIKRYSTEKDSINRSELLGEIGLTQTPLAREYLLKQLKTNNPTDNLYVFFGILDGFEYLGDKSTISELRVFEDDRKLETDLKEMVEVKIERITKGIKMGPFTDFDRDF